MSRRLQADVFVCGHSCVLSEMSLSMRDAPGMLAMTIIYYSFLLMILLPSFIEVYKPDTVKCGEGSSEVPVDFYMCTHPQNHPSDQNRIHFQHPRGLPGAFFQSISSKGNHNSDFCLHK